MVKEAVVAIVDLTDGADHALAEAIDLIGGIRDLNTPKRPVAVKVGIFNHKSQAHTTVEVAGAITRVFNKSRKILLVESDNYKGTGTERLEIWESLCDRRVAAFNLSEDKDTRIVEVAGEEVPLSHVLFKPSVLVSTHILRGFDKGSVIKNLLGLVPDRRKARFHKNLETALLDMFEAVGGIDLAVLDASYAYKGTGDNPHARPEDSKNRTRTDLLVVGRDAVAVETIGAKLAGLDTRKMKSINEAARRGVGVCDLNRIKILGISLDIARGRIPKTL
jgi:uncharacterized protein (DUF362 family)